MPFVRLHLPALLTSIALSAWFMLVYRMCNFIASQRAHVGSWSYAWERHIPFIPAFIIPYMSIDVFFFFAPFLCDAEERRVLVKRIFFAIAVAGVFFIVMPLRLDLRPTVTGWVAPIFKSLRLFDQPFNMAPSLHITLLVILFGVYTRRTRDLLKLAVAVWFFFVALSTLLVYQHHVVDVISGFMLAAIALYLFPEGDVQHDVTPNRRVATRYAIGAAVCFALAFVWPWWSLWMLWPALSLVIAATGYTWFGPAIYRKRDGQIPISARLLLGPVLLGQAWSLQHYSKRSNPHDTLTDRLLIGRRLDHREAAALVADGVCAVVDLTGEFSASQPLLGIAYLNVQISDLTAPTHAQLDRAVAFIRDHLPRGKVYVHCKAGYSRTAAVAGAALLEADRSLTAERAIEMLRAARRGIVVRPEIVESLHRYAARRTL